MTKRASDKNTATEDLSPQKDEVGSCFRQYANFFSDSELINVEENLKL
jgi:hypothetical protein